MAFDRPRPGRAGASCSGRGRRPGSIDESCIGQLQLGTATTPRARSEISTMRRICRCGLLAVVLAATLHPHPLSDALYSISATPPSCLRRHRISIGSNPPSAALYVAQAGVGAK